mmetsp:Transcript_56537/g.112249  ORF Transcript_56537/g.112249 Transcript_56537/m.112249 type:complete len:328 (-) Transcript_56537:452-1435(-)
MPVLKYWNPVLRSLHPLPRPRRRPSPLPSPPAAHTHSSHSAHSTCAPLPFRQQALHHVLHHTLRPPRVCSRYYLGVLPESSIATSSAAAVTLRALSLGAEDLPADTYVALALECPDCYSRISGGASGGELWITFRGDGATCSDGHVPNSMFGTTFQCHTDHDHKYNKVFVHYKNPGLAAGLTVEKWYWLADGETYTLPSGGYGVLTVCSVGEALDAATVALGATGAEALDKCTGPASSSPSPSPPSPSPPPPSPSPPPPSPPPPSPSSPSPSPPPPSPGLPPGCSFFSATDCVLTAEQRNLRCRCQYSWDSTCGWPKGVEVSCDAAS